MSHSRRQFVQLVGLAALGCSSDETNSSSKDAGVGGSGGAGNGGAGGTAGAGGADAGADSGVDAAADAGADGGPPIGAIDGSPWGIATSHSSSLNLGWLSTIAATGFECIRGFDRANTDARLKDAAALGVESTGILAMGGSFPADDIAGWKSYIKGLLTEAAGRVKYWEVWNEPPNFSTDKTPESYGAIVKAAYEEVKAFDATLQVGLCAASVHLNFLDRALLAGAADHFDYVTLHPYETLGLVDRGFEAQFMATVPAVRRLLEARSAARREVPVIFTELGEPVQNGITPEHQADTFIKAYVLSLAQGVARIHWFEGVDGDSGPFGLIAQGGSPRVSLTAAKTLIAELGSRPKYHGWVLLNDTHYGFVFDSARGGRALIAWARPGANANVDLGELVTLVEPNTGAESMGMSLSVGASPRFVRGSLDMLLSQAQQNHSKPFPWEGDYSAAGGVELSAASGELGLHFLGAPPITNSLGEPAFDMSQGAAHPICVDPNFLLYDTVPIRIRAVVRRLDPGTNAGFNVKYESTTGTHGTPGWNGVPADDQWHELTWDIDDVQFVGKWGYHLSLDSDSTANSGYALRSLRVEKR